MTIAETFNLAIRNADEFTKRELFHALGEAGRRKGELRIVFSDGSIAINVWSLKMTKIDMSLSNIRPPYNDFVLGGAL